MDASPINENKWIISMDAKINENKWISMDGCQCNKWK